MQHPCQLRFLFARDIDTSHYTALKIGRRGETGRKKRVTPEFGEYRRRKIIPPQILGVTNLPPLKESCPWDSMLVSKEFGILGHQIIFTLPSCFFLRVVTPSDFAHPDSVPPGDPVCSLQNLHWLLDVGQVFLDLDSYKTTSSKPFFYITNHNKPFIRNFSLCRSNHLGTQMLWMLMHANAMM